MVKWGFGGKSTRLTPFLLNDTFRETNSAVAPQGRALIQGGGDGRR